jgi:hypothetical protein
MSPDVDCVCDLVLVSPALVNQEHATDMCTYNTYLDLSKQILGWLLIYGGTIPMYNFWLHL